MSKLTERDFRNADEAYTLIKHALYQIQEYLQTDEDWVYGIAMEITAEVRKESGYDLELKEYEEAVWCPRCDKNKMREPYHTNALSRASSINHDSLTYVCSACGTDEALIEFYRHPKKKWVKPTKDIKES